MLIISEKFSGETNLTGLTHSLTHSLLEEIDDSVLCTWFVS